MSTYKMVTDIPPSITTPNSVETRLGTLRFFDGLPDEATVQKVYDNLDFQRAVQAFLTALPAASLSATRAGIRTFGPDNQTMLITESLMDSHTLLLTANTETIYTLGWLDTKAGPLVIEVPPRALGMIDDFWQRYVGDVGNAGPDRGQGGKYLLLPPDHSGDVPAGYFVLRSRTYGNLLGVRAFIVGGDVRAAADSVKSQLRIYPLAEAADPPETSFVNISGAWFNTIHANDVTFFDEVVPVVQEEPLEATDPEVRGLLAAIGIRKGTPFAPDDRMRSILAEGAAVGNATARALVFSARNQDAYYYPDSAWQLVWIGNDYQFSPGGVLDLDARALFYYMGLGISPAMAVKMVGIGSQYGMAYHDGAGQYLNGGKSYRLRLPGPIPAKDFWSIVVYDPQTRTMLQTDQQFPSLSSQKPDIAVNPDAAVDIYFGPEAPAGQEANWIQTIPGKGWFVALRLYGPLEPWFDKSWRPGEIELVS
ncbi:DUF1254 domain-containing protein [Rhodococcus rhodochrous]|uniref:DUF1254 domain-containing protein n=1 Tax=Rhodococcus rhodochrous TaxID=1829 RepID=UPI000B2E58E7|nr:DUF1254 domain-containing protein [Rhodococcus rhodochrous]